MKRSFATARLGALTILLALSAAGVSAQDTDLTKARDLYASAAYDDALDVFGVHGIGGIWGALATGLFASKAVNPAGADGLFYGNPHQLLNQAIAIGASVVLAMAGTFIILKVVSLVTPLRVSEEDEYTGLDLVLHGEVAYNFFGPSMNSTTSNAVGATANEDDYPAFAKETAQSS